MEKKQTPEELRKRYEEAVEQSIAAFPYQSIEVEGTEALATWERLRVTHPGSSPVVVGGLEEFKRIVEGATAWPGRPAHRTPRRSSSCSSIINCFPVGEARPAQMMRMDCSSNSICTTVVVPFSADVRINNIELLDHGGLPRQVDRSISADVIA